jgi:hypothetical protein
MLVTIFIELILPNGDFSIKSAYKLLKMVANATLRECSSRVEDVFGNLYGHHEFLTKLRCLLGGLLVIFFHIRQYLMKAYSQPLPVRCATKILRHYFMPCGNVLHLG